MCSRSYVRIENSSGSKQSGALDEALLTGEGVPDETLVELVAKEIQDTNSAVERKETGGWLIDGFPRTLKQAELLEKALSGYEDAKPVKPGNIKRNPKQNANKKSLIAPAPGSAGSDRDTPRSGVQLVLQLRLSKEELQKRSESQSLDEHQQGVAKQWQHQILQFEENEKNLHEWFSKFDNIRVIDVAKSPTDVAHEVDGHVDGILALKLEGDGTDRPASASEKKDEPKSSLMPSKELAETLVSEWSAIESTYSAVMTFCFRGIRREEDAVTNHIYNQKRSFVFFLNRPDNKQAMVEQFQRRYNDMEEDLRLEVPEKGFTYTSPRSDYDTKAELHQQIEDVREKLWEVCDTRRKEAESLHETVVHEHFIEEHISCLVNYYIAMLQSELDRYHLTRFLVNDYYKDLDGKVALPSNWSNRAIQLIDDAAYVQVKLPFLNNANFAELQNALNQLRNLHPKLNQRPIGPNADATFGQPSLVNLLQKPQKKEFLKNQNDAKEMLVEFNEALHQALASIPPDEDEQMKDRAKKPTKKQTNENEINGKI